MSAPSSSIILKCRNIHLSYGEKKALQGVDFDLAKGEIHALIGEHRAGKSSLIKILSGAERCRQGEIFYENKKISFFTPSSSIKYGISTVYQDLNIVSTLNSIENIFNGRRLHTMIGTLAHKKMYEETKKIFKELKFDFSFTKPLHRLSQSEQYLVEFARAYSTNPKILLLDEISNKLTPEEMQKIYRVILELKEKGVSIVYISHDLDEILKISDRITILKEGLRRGTENTQMLDKFRLYQLTYSFSLDKETIGNGQIEFYLFLQYLEGIINDLPVGVILLDNRNTIKMVNLTASEILETKPEQIINKSAQWLTEYFSRESKSQFSETINFNTQNNLDVVNFASGKSLHLRIIPVHDSQGDKLISTTILIEDKTKEQDITDYLVESEKMASVASVSVGIAHEINNPLAIIKNYIEIINETGISGDVANSIHKIEVELNRIIEIVSSLLSFSRIKQIPKKTINIVKQFKEILTLLNHLLLEKNLIVHTDFPHDSIYIHFDENKFKQVFLNIITNSIDALLDKGEIWIEVIPRQRDSEIEIRIRDNGYGIPDEVWERIFDPFFTTKVTSKNTGLGLTICKHIIESYNGRIECKSETGMFTTFSIYLPIDQS